ncbi:hypothetical protein BGAL_0040g00390 [Botrytis galanthina]|uniref:Glucose-methanol-choline oxidoreductase N-terminal domain-containing protein n=1 Tax=Botrytis galanthina TaxID=278940 RepID=A0A4S8R777_9HELO|nr:hypothetical protein BGAL_0040g00390 [Botrytis galanthina]
MLWIRSLPSLATTVLIIEAGELDQGEDFIYIPLFAGIGNGAIGTQYDWNLTYAPQPATNNRSIAIPLGKVVGGGSCLNKMTFDLAGREDYDRWIEVGAIGWNELFPYFKKLTNFTTPAPEIAIEWDIQTDPSAHGYKGHVMRSVLRIDVFDSLNGDANGALWNPQSLDPDTKTRSNSRTAYWNSASNRTNLHLLTGQQVTKLITKLNNKGVKVIGVEIVSSASSITPASYLPSDVDSTILAGYEAQYKILTRDLASNKMPIMEFIFGGGPVLAGLQHPFSRGSVAITSADPFTSPSANPGFLTHQTDLLLLSAAAKYARKIINTPIFAPLSPVETVPGPSIQTDADFEAWVRSTIGTTFHPSGTTSMMNRQYGGVVDSNYKVYGVDNLRVVDAGTFPMIQSAHLQVTVYAMAERASDAIKKSWRL